jgi:ABC-2 type transport system permease protein
MSATATHLTRTTAVELRLFLREPAATFFTLVLPVLLLLLNGSTNTNAPSAELGGAGAIDVLVPGFMALVIATLGLTNVPGTLATYRERGILRRLQATPVRPSTVLGAQLAVQGLVATVGLVLLVAIGMVGFDLNTPASVLGVLVAYVLGVLGFAGFGFVMAAVMPTARASQAASFALYLPMIFLSGATWPREMLPEWADTIANVLPLTYVVEAIRQPWHEGTMHLGALGLLAAMTVAGLVVSSRLFRWS